MNTYMNIADEEDLFSTKCLSLPESNAFQPPILSEKLPHPISHISQIGTEKELQAFISNSPSQTINLRVVIDYGEYRTFYPVIDESKQIEYERSFKEWSEKYQETLGPDNNVSSVDAVEEVFMPQSTLRDIGHPPEVPVKCIEITGTVIFYFNGNNRVIPMKYVDFDEMYTAYIKKQRLGEM